MLWPDRQTANVGERETPKILNATLVPVILPPALAAAHSPNVAPWTIPLSSLPILAQRHAISVAAAEDAFEATSLDHAESLGQFARRIGVSPSKLRRLNPQLDGFDDKDPLSSGTVIVMPSIRGR